jgi:hypothetical protein
MPNAKINSSSTVGDGRSDVATGRAFEAGLISTADSSVENIFSGAHFCANRYAR